MEPAYIVKGAGGRGRIIPIAFAHVRAAETEFAGRVVGRLAFAFQEPRFGKHHGLTDRAFLSKSFLDGHRKTIDADFGEAVSLLQNYAALFVGVDQIDRQRRAAAVDT